MKRDQRVVRALAALAAGEWRVAAELASAAVNRSPDSRLAAALCAFLQAQSAPGVYDEPTAFETFIDHGTNPEMYRRTIELLGAIHTAEAPSAVLDIGCGDGRVTAAVLAADTTRVDLVEPSDSLLGQAAAAVVRPGLDVVEHEMGVGELAAHVGPDQRWGIAQSTFALHAIPPGERPELLRWLRERVDRLLIVEFDVPELADGSLEHVAYLAERYEVGVREYVDHPDAVSGFLMPVLAGQLDPARRRYTFEQPIGAWVGQLEDAGWQVTTAPVFDYWWAPAVLIDARPAA